jgi:DNA-binding MarR family transcriptional regulator
MKRQSSPTKEKRDHSSQLKKGSEDTTSGWTFLSNHSHVIICLARDPEMRVRDIAIAVGITERATIRIISELEEAGYVHKEKIGRRNRYSIVADKNFRHPLEAHHSIRGILALAKR